MPASVFLNVLNQVCLVCRRVCISQCQNSLRRLPMSVHIVQGILICEFDMRRRRQNLVTGAPGALKKYIYILCMRHRDIVKDID